MSTPNESTESGTLAEHVNRQIDAEVKAWPEEVRQTDPGPGDAEARLAWIEAYRPLARRIATLAREAEGYADAWTEGARRYRFQQEGDVPWTP